MEKLIYALWRDPAVSREAFNTRLLGQVADELSPHVHALRVNVQDRSVEGGTNPRFVVTEPQMEAVVQIWVDSAFPPNRRGIETALGNAAQRIEGWLVAESTALLNRLHPPRSGKPTEGFSQIVFFERPSTMDFETWRRNWQDDHTEVAIVTQTSFEYIQNLVVRPLTGSAGAYAAIVEECFPAAAINDRALFFNAAGDPAKLEDNYARMMDSCGRFMGPAGCDCIPTRQYELKPLTVTQSTSTQ